MREYNWGGSTARTYPVFPAYHQSYGTGNKKEGGIDPRETEEQVIEAVHRASTVEELLYHQDPHCVCSTILGN